MCEARIGGLVFALVKDLVNRRYVDLGTEVSARGTLHAVRGPGVHEIRVIREVRARVDVPVFGGHDVGVVIAMLAHIIRDGGGSNIAHLSAERSAGKIIVLQINQHQNRRITRGSHNSHSRQPRCY